MIKKIVAFLVAICVVFSLASCSFSDEFESEFANQLQESIEKEVDEAVEQTKKEVTKKVKKEAEKIKLKNQVNNFRNQLKKVNVNKKNRAEMLYVMESILEICEQNSDLVYEAMEIRALYDMSTLMIDAQSIYEDINEIDGAVSDLTSLITGDYVQIFADKAVNQAMKKWEKQADKSIDDAIESTLNNIAGKDKIWEVLTEKYLKENGY